MPRRCRFLEDSDVIRGDDECVSLTGYPFPTANNTCILYAANARVNKGGDWGGLVGRTWGAVRPIFVWGSERKAPVLIRRWEDYDEDEDSEDTADDWSKKIPITVAE